MKKYVSIDIGGTEIKYGVIDDNGSICQKEKRNTPPQGGPAIMETVFDIIKTYQQQAQISGICISTAGMVNVEEGTIFYAAPLIPNYAGTAFKEELERYFHIPCEVENDVNCAGLAEQRTGASKGSNVTLCLTIGTGIGGCILIDGNVFHGYSNSACEVGYMHMFDQDFQTLGATRILCQKVANKKQEDISFWNGYAIFEHAKQGDAICIEAITQMCDILGQGIANICYVINPKVVVLGGGIMSQEQYLRPFIEKSVEKYLVSSIFANTEIAFAKHENDAGMLGAFYHFKAMQEKRFKIH